MGVPSGTKERPWLVTGLLSPLAGLGLASDLGTHR